MDIKKEAVETRNPRRYLQPGQSPHQRALEKFIIVLVWIYQWHITISPLIQDLLGTTETTFLRELEKKGYVKSFPAPRLVSGTGYMLTKDGVNIAAGLLEEELQYSTHPASVSHANLKHDLSVQRFAIICKQKGFDVSRCRDSASINEKIPDAYLQTGERKYAVEIELTGKWDRELEQSLNGHLKAIEKAKWTDVLYVSNSKSILNRYEERLKSPIPDWFQSMSHGQRRWIRGDSQTLDEQTLAKFRFFRVPNLLKGFEQVKL